MSLFCQFMFTSCRCFCTVVCKHLIVSTVRVSVFVCTRLNMSIAKQMLCHFLVVFFRSVLCPDTYMSTYCRVVVRHFVCPDVCTLVVLTLIREFLCPVVCTHIPPVSCKTISVLLCTNVALSVVRKGSSVLVIVCAHHVLSVVRMFLCLVVCTRFVLSMVRQSLWPDVCTRLILSVVRTFRYHIVRIRLILPVVIRCVCHDWTDCGETVSLCYCVYTYFRVTGETVSLSHVTHLVLSVCQFLCPLLHNLFWCLQWSVSGTIL